MVRALNEVTGEERYSRVRQTFIRQADKIYQLTYEDGTLIETTWSHPFYIRGKGWVKAEDLVEGDVSQTEGNGSLKITKIHVDVRGEEVYNFEVEEDHNYYVSEAGVLVHNEGYEPYLAALNKELAPSFAQDLFDEVTGELEDKAMEKILCHGKAKKLCEEALSQLKKTYNVVSETEDAVDTENPILMLGKQTTEEVQEELRADFVKKVNELKRAIKQREKFLRGYNVEWALEDLEMQRGLGVLMAGMGLPGLEPSQELLEVERQADLLTEDRAQLKRTTQQFIDQNNRLTDARKAFEDNNMASGLDFLGKATNYMELQTQYRVRNEVEALSDLYRFKSLLHDPLLMASEYMKLADPKFFSPLIGSNDPRAVPVTEREAAYLNTLPSDVQKSTRVLLMHPGAPIRFRTFMKLKTYEFYRGSKGKRNQGCLTVEDVPYGQSRITERVCY